MSCGGGAQGCGGPPSCGNPCPPGARSLQFTVQTPGLFAHSLARALIPVVDAVRDLNARFGMRPYVTRWVFTSWSGGARGVGPEIVGGTPPKILPPPLLLAPPTP